MQHQEPFRQTGTGPRFFYGYIVVAAAFIIQFTMFAPRASFGLYIKPFIADFGWTRALISGAFALGTIVIGVSGIIAGALNDRFGPRVMLSFLGVVLATGYLLMSRIQAPWQLYIFYAAGIGIGMGGYYVPMLSTVARWFSKRRSVMTGLTMAGGGIGGMVGPPLVNWLIASQGWRNSLIITGVLVVVVIIIVAQFFRRSPASMGLKPYGAGEPGDVPEQYAEAGGLSLEEALRTRQFWMAAAMQFCQGFCMITMMVHIAPHATDIGLSASSSAVFLAIISGSHVAGGVFLGNIADRIGTRKVYIVSFVLLAAALLWLVYSGNTWMFVIFSVVLGIGGGGGSLTSPLVAELFGIKSHGVILGVSAFATTIGASAGPLIAGYIFDVTGSYTIAFWLCFALAAAGLVMTLLLRPPKKR